MGTPTANKNLIVPTLNGDFGTWGSELAGDVSTLDLNLGGYQYVNVAGGINVSATLVQSQYLYTILTGVITANIQYIFPPVGGLYIVANETTGNFTVTLACAGGGLNVVCPQNSTITVVTDAVNCVSATGAYVQQGGATVTTGILSTGLIGGAAGFDSAGYDSGGANFRATAGNYGAMFRNDGVSAYWLSTASGNSLGLYNNLRPFSWNLATGAVIIDGTGAGTILNGLCTANSFSTVGALTAFNVVGTQGTIGGAIFPTGGGISLSGNITASGGLFGSSAQVSAPGQGYVQLSTGGAPSTGYVGFFGANGVRAGYVGFGSAGTLNLTCDPGYTNFNINASCAISGAMSAASIFNYGATTLSGLLTCNAGIAASGSLTMAGNISASGAIIAGGNVSGLGFIGSNISLSNTLACVNVVASNTVTAGSCISTTQAQTYGAEYVGSIVFAGYGTSGSGSGGYCAKNGVNGALSGNVCNFWWDGVHVYVYVDSTPFLVNTVSDERFKQQIVPLANEALDRIDRIKPVSYRLQDKGIVKDDNQTKEGMLAQNVLEVIPSAVIGDASNPDHILHFDPLPIIATLVKAVQELRLEVKDLRKLVQV